MTADTGRGRPTYRHGNVRAEAVAAARRMVRDGGAASLSLRQVAAALGIAHRSLYNHFADRDALLRAVAAQGYADLAGTLAAAGDGPAFRRAYLGFALEQPAVYGLMMAQSRDAIAGDPELAAAVEKVIALAIAALAIAALGDPGAGAEDNRRAVMRDWMFLHGAVALQASGILQARGREDFLAEAERIRNA